MEEDEERGRRAIALDGVMHATGATEKIRHTVLGWNVSAHAGQRAIENKPISLSRKRRGHEEGETEAANEKREGLMEQQPDTLPYPWRTPI